MVELEDGGDDGDACPEGMQKREALEGLKIGRLKGCAEEERTDADADGGAQEPGEEDAKDDERQHRGEILAGVRVR